ncbi:MAG: penicillin acylase family protein [Pirellulales bacterium]|nr:penicillin acylase family protein [Pirellulales bacterium]
MYFDTYDIPHVYAESWVDAARAVGYLHASARLGQMDIFRRQASGRLAELMGAGALESDKLMRLLGVRRTCEAFWKSDAVPAEYRAEIEAYCAGVNQRIVELTPDKLPLTFQALGYRPTLWEPVDCLVMTKYMGWDQSGTEDDLWFGTMIEKLGADVCNELWPLDRPYELPIVSRQVERQRLPAPGTQAGVASGLPAGLAALYERTFARLAASRLHPRSDSFGSNNWAVAGSKTASGKPILASDPHLGFRLPSLWYAAHVSVRGKNVTGVMFPGNHTVVIGHTDHHAWGITNMQADAVDYYVETVKDDDARQYLHRGQWKTMDVVTEKIAVQGQGEVELQVESTVHGPVVSREGGRVVTLAWPGTQPTSDALAFWKGQRVETLEGFLDALDLIKVPNLNICYADVEGNIAIHPCGSLPVRLPGQGRVPMDGASGDYDWQGMIPSNRLPLSVNPPEGYVGSANGRPSPQGYPYYLGWMWDDSYRTRRMHDVLQTANKVTIADMQKLQYDTHDKCAERFLPVLLASLTGAEMTDPLAKAARAALADWDFVADPEAIAPAIWLRWFEEYRDGVWRDEWARRGIEQPGGSWGYSGNNRREPMLEVLEFLTLEQPNSPWFDVADTAAQETRDDVARAAFGRAVGKLKMQFGDDVNQWVWGKINILRIGSLTEQPELAREGGPVPGTAFTLNPGSNVGHVGGGASWRMLVDFSQPDASLGVYPGGQSEDPTSPHYDDLMPLWAAGKYVDMAAFRRTEQGRREAAERARTFVP